MRQHSRARAESRVSLERSISTCLDVADELENNTRACLGIQLKSVQTNQAALDGAVRKLTKEIVDVTKRLTTYRAQHEGLIASMRDAGSVATWLTQSESALAGIQDNFSTIERILTSDA